MSISELFSSVTIVGLEVLIKIVVCLLGAVAIYGVSKLCTLLNLDNKEIIMQQVKNIIDDIVVELNQTKVEDLKILNNGKLTEEQKVEVYNMCLNAVKEILSTKQVKTICSYFGGIELEDALKTLIENSVSDNKK